MKIASIAEISFFDNVILQKIIEVDDNATWKDAYIAYLKDKEETDSDYSQWVLTMPDDLEQARIELGNGEMDVCVTFYKIN